MTQFLSLAIAWLPMILIAGVMLFTGTRLSRQYRDNLELSRAAIETIRENTEAIRELTRRIGER